MRYIHLFIFCFRDTFIKLKNNKLLNFITILTISITLSIFGIFYLFLYNLDNAISPLADKVQIITYLKEDIKDVRIEGLKREFSNIAGIRDTLFISKDAALKRFKEKFKEHADLVDTFKGFPIPDSYIIYLNKAYIKKDSLDMIASKIRKLEGVESIDYGGDWIESINTAISIGRFLLIVVSSFLLGGMIFIISNTIKLSLYNYTDEIEIMKLIGAPYWTIKFPFLFHGFIQGFIGALFSEAFIYIVYLYVFNNLSERIALMPGWFDMVFLPLDVIVSILIFGSSVGLLGSFISLRRLITN